MEIEILVYTEENGIEISTINKAWIDLSIVYFFYEFHGNTIIKNEYGEYLAIVNLPYEQFKKLFLKQNMLSNNWGE